MIRPTGAGRDLVSNVVLEFGDYRLDIARRELRRDGDLITLEPKVFDLLAFLVQNRDRVVSKDDLLQAVWGGRIVSESALTTRINAVRRVLGDDGTSQQLVRTFTRKGIRFIGGVTEVSDSIVPPPHDASSRLSTAGEKPSIAVLPFTNMSGDPEQEYFADGMVEEITTAMSRLPWPVIARNSSFTYRGRAVDVRQVARELGVRYVLEGSVRKAGNRVRIAAQLIDATAGAHIWADRFDGTLDDIFDLEDRVASSVVVAIEPRLRTAEIERSSRKPTECLEAYDFYLRALVQSRKRTKDSLAEAVRLLNHAHKLDPAYAYAMEYISSCRVLQRSRHWIRSSGPEVDEGIAMARQAISAAWDNPIILSGAGFALAFSCGRKRNRTERDRSSDRTESECRPGIQPARFGSGVSKPARRGDPRRARGDAAGAAWSVDISLCPGAGLCTFGRRSLRGGAAICRPSFARKRWPAGAALQAKPVRSSRSA